MGWIDINPSHTPVKPAKKNFPENFGINALALRQNLSGFGRRAIQYKEFIDCLKSTFQALRLLADSSESNNQRKTHQNLAKR